MSTHNICFYKEVNVLTNTKTTKLLDCALVGVCAKITGRSNMVRSGLEINPFSQVDLKQYICKQCSLR